MADFEKKVSLIEIEVDNEAANAKVNDLTNSIISQKNAIKENSDQIKSLNKSNKDLQKEVDKGNISQKEANKQIQENTKESGKLEKQNFALKDELKDLNKERGSAVKATKLQSNSLDALRKTVADQKKELNGLNTETVKGRKRFDELTESLKDNNEKIRELDQGAGDFKTTVGNYREEVDKALESTDGLTGGLTGTAKGMAANTKAALAFIATPIGAVVGALAAAFLLVRNAMNRNEEAANKVNRIFTQFEGIINFVLKALEPLGEFLIDGIVKGFELAAEAADKAVGFLSDALSTLGFDSAAESVDNFSESVTKAVKASGELADIEAQLQKEIRKTERITLEYQRRAEELRQVRDDDTLSIRERIKANQELGSVLEQQLNEELRIANLQLDAANRRIELEGETTENLDARGEALTRIADINERITGQESEQLVNRNSLLREQKALEEEVAKEQQATRQENIAKQEAANAKELEEAKKIADAKVENEKALNQRLLALQEFRRSQQNEKRLEETEDLKEFYELKAEIEAENFENERERLLEQAEITLEDEDLTAEERKIRQAEIDLELEELRASHADKMTSIADEQKDEELKIEQEKQAKKTELIRAAQQTGRNVINAGLETTNNLIDNFYQKRYDNIEKQLKNGDITEREYAKKKEQIDRNRARSVWKSEVAQFRIKKALSLTSIAIDTASGVAKELRDKGIPAGLVSAGIIAANGIAQGIVVGTEKAPPPPTFAKGGDVFGVIAGGNLHSQGGTKYQGEDGNAFEVERDEGIFVTKRDATNPALQMLNEANTMAGGRSMFNSSSRFLQDGGEVSRSNDTTMMAKMISDSILSAPAPVLPVQSVMAGINAETKAKNVGVI